MNLSLGTKVSAIVALIILLISTISTSIFITSHSRSIEREIIARGTALSEALAKAAETGLTTEDLNLLSRASHVVRSEDVSIVQVYSSLWTVADAYPLEKLNEPPMPEAIDHFKRSNRSFFTQTGGNHDFYSPVTFKPFEDAAPSNIGYVRVALSSDHIRNAIREMVVTHLIIAATLTMAAVVVLNTIIGRLVVTPVITLNKSMAQFRDGIMPDSVLPRSSDEIGELYREFIRMSRTIRAKEEALERSNRELQDFAFVASHDLQEPLRKVIAFGGRLKTTCGTGLDEKSRDYLERMQRAAGRMQQLIEDLLQYSRLTSRPNPFEPTDLNEVAKEVIIDLEERIRQTNGRIEKGELPTIEAERLQISALFQNLIANALKFHKEGVPPVIVLKSRLTDPGYCEITIEDNGIGFDEKYLDRIFKPFQRLHGRNEFEGTGMGLAICYKIARRHGGEITAKSVPGRGSTFMVSLPLRQKDPMAL